MSSRPPQATALVFVGGDTVPAGLASTLPSGAHVVAADSGAVTALALGLAVDVLVGDLDSCPSDVVAAVEAAGATVQRHPVDKDATDLELAVLAAADAGVDRVVVVGGSGGRLDHTLGNVLVLASPRFADLEMEAVTAAGRVVVVRGRPVTLTGRPGDLVTLLAVHGPAAGVHTTGLRWALDGDTLVPGSSRGVSNELAASAATVRVADGVVLAVQPTAGR